MWQKIKQLKEERGQTLTEMKAILKKAEDEKRDLTSEENAKFDELNTKAEQRKTDIERYERAQALETELAGQRGEQQRGEQRVGRDAVNTPEQKADDQAAEQRAQFDRYLRGTSPMELRALTVAGTGVVGDRPFYNQLVTTLKSWAGVRQAGATVLPTSDGNPLTIPTGDDSANTGQIVGEGATDNTNADPAVGNVTLGAHRFDSKWIKVSLEMLGTTVRELLARIDSRELAEWQAYFAIEPWGEQRDDLRAGTVAAVTANCHSASKVFKPSDFMPDFETTRTVPQTPEQLMNLALKANAMMGGTVTR